MATVKHILWTKTDQFIHTIDENASVYDAVALMSKAGVGALVVMDGDVADARVCGIVTERDYARKVILQDRASRTTTVREIMTTSVLSATLRTTADECMALMTQHRIRHLPVIESGRLVGMVSIGDMVRQVIEEQQFAIDQLEIYVRGPQHEPSGTQGCALTRRSPLPQTLVAHFA